MTALSIEKVHVRAYKTKSSIRVALSIFTFRLLLEILQCSTISRIMNMYTVVETPTFLKSAEKLWTEQDRVEFVNWIAKVAGRGEAFVLFTSMCLKTGRFGS